MVNFVLVILEVLEEKVLEEKVRKRELLYKKEQYFLDKFNPSYNVLKIAGSNKGFKHSILSREKMSKARLNIKHSIGHKVEVTDVVTKKVETFLTKTDAAKFFGAHPNIISQRDLRGTKNLYRGRYTIEFLKKDK